MAMSGKTNSERMARSTPPVIRSLPNFLESRVEFRKTPTSRTVI
ncbi:MAG: hypothetical protein OK456_06380 [Thaumarchaeota archaeon]|nr:hypothetical protein [Nitrososphaerota archaeon]